MKNSKYDHFDAHCHIFNLEYLFLEAAQMAWDYLTGRYPFTMEEGKEPSGVAPQTPLDQIGELIRWIIQVGSAAVGSERRNAEFLFSTAKSELNREISITPLMMDIYYMFYPPVEAGKVLKNIQTKKVGDPEAEFRKFIDEIFKTEQGATECCKRIMQKFLALLGLSHGPERMVRGIAERLIVASPEVSKRPYHTTPGFELQIARLIELRELYPDRVYPFLAVDPRREGLIDYIREGNLVDKERGPFFGIKLYPRLGYMPNIPELEGLYEYCAAKGLPITTHCSYNGFPGASSGPLSRWPYAGFGNPDYYDSIFKKHTQIRIDLAHFGDSATTVAWANSIVGLIKRYRGRVFSDMSCTTEQTDLKNWIANPNYGGDPEVLSQTMFGSDFDVLYFNRVGMTLDRYDTFFRDILSADDLKSMMRDTPNRFLG
jgi:predicted TIM-barrel fold metal-dependent hydrolase